MSSHHVPDRLCPTSGCPYCARPSDRSSRNYEDEHVHEAIKRAYGLYDSEQRNSIGDRTPMCLTRSEKCPNKKHYYCNHCFENWHHDKLLTVAEAPFEISNYLNQCIMCHLEDSSHPRTRTQGSAVPDNGNDAMEVELRNEDKEVWYTNWQFIKPKISAAIKAGDCETIQAVMEIMKKNTKINNTVVNRNTFIPVLSNGAVHNGLFVKPRCVLQPGVICAVMCSNENPIYIRPNAAVYHIQKMSVDRPEYFLRYSIDPAASIIGAAANSHLRKKDPANNAVYKQLPIWLNGEGRALTVLVTIVKLMAGDEIIVDYGNSFDKRFHQPMAVLS